MKITQLVATNTKTPYHESVASRLPRGIKTQQQLLNRGYRIAVEDLGLAKAKRLNENFAAKLVNSYHNQSLNEGVGSFLGKVAGNVVGGVQAAGRGLKGAWNDAKQGYADAKASWDPKTGSPAAPAAAPATSGTPAAAPATSGTPAAAPATTGTPAAVGGADRPYVAPASGGAAEPAAPEASPGSETPSPPVAGTPPKTGGGVGDIMKAIDGLDPASKKQLAGELDKSINTPPPAAEKPADTTAPEAPEAPAAPAAAPEAQGAGAFGQMAAQLGGQKPNTMANAPVSKTNVAKPGNPNAAAPAAPAPAVDPKAQQANLKARLKTGQGMGTKTGTGFKQSRVGVPVQKLVGKNPDGSPKFSTVREEVEFHSKFLGMII